MISDQPDVVDPRTADVYTVLDDLSDLVENARAMPMSDKCVVGRNQVLDLLDAIRMMLPKAVQEAEELLADRAAVIEDGYQQAERAVAQASAQADAVLEQASVQQAHMVSEHQVTAVALDQAEEIRAHAQSEADAIRAEAAEHAEAMRRDVDQYVEEKFAAFEASLTKTLATVQRGRERIRERYAASDGGPAKA